MAGQVIFIDDEAAIRQAVQQWLELSGFQVHTFSRAREALTALERRIVMRFSTLLREIHPELVSKERPLLMPVTMSLFGMMNWVYMWFKEGGAISRDDYADVATTLILEGVKAVR